MFTSRKALKEEIDRLQSIADARIRQIDNESAQRARAQRDERLHKSNFLALQNDHERLKKEAKALRDEVSRLQRDRAVALQERDDAASHLVQIRGLLETLPDLSGVEVEENNEVVLGVSYLAADQRALSERIDAALGVLGAKKRRTPTETKIAEILRGGQATEDLDVAVVDMLIPDSPEGLEDTA